jgi:pilus assembly protein CpaB
MNRTRIILVVVVAALLALLASVGAYKFLSEKSRIAETARLQTVGITVALVDIPLGSTINPNQVGIAAWPKETYPKDSFPIAKSVVGRMAFRDFVRGEPIVESKLVPASGAGAGILSLKVPPKMRAFSVKVNEVVGVGGFIIPGSRVDVVVTTTPPAQRQQEQISKIVLENILVLAAGQVIEQKENKPVTVNTVTLALTPEDSEKLALASNDGKIQLALRNFADNDNVLTTGSDKARLLSSYRFPGAAPAAADKPSGLKRVKNKASRPAAEAPQRKRYVVEVLRGNKRSEEKFE